MGIKKSLENFFVKIPKKKHEKYKVNRTRLNTNSLRITAITSFFSAFGFYLKLKKYPTIMDSYYIILFILLGIVAFSYFIFSIYVKEYKIQKTVNKFYLLFGEAWITLYMLLDQIVNVRGSTILYALVVLLIAICFIEPVFIFFVYTVSLIFLSVAMPMVHKDIIVTINEMMGIIPLFMAAFGLQIYLYRTDRRNFVNEEHRENEKEKIKLIIDSLPSYIFIEDIDGKIEMVNRSIATVFSREPESFEGMSSVDFGMSHEDFLRHNEESREIIKTGQTLFKIDNIKKDGRSFGWFQIIKTPYQYRDGEKPLVLGIATDITELKETKEKLEVEKEKAVEANKAKSQFLANMSHEIRTPLNAIMGFGDLIIQSDLNKIQYRYIENIKKSANSLLSIVNDILDLSKIEAGKLELEIIRTNIVELTREAGELIRTQTKEKNLAYSIEVEEDMPKYALIDPLRLKQVLANLLSNAVKFTSKGEIKLTLTFEKLTETKGLYSFVVKDTGTGISFEKQEKLFDAFFQGDISTTRKYGGTGLGLSITQKFLKFMGSDISVNSVEGEGSSFAFELESEYFYEEDKENIQNYDVEFEVVTYDKVKILIVDDVDLNIELMICIIKEYLPNSRIIKAFNGIEAIEHIKDDKPDLVFMDVQMPKMDGISATKEIRAYEKVNNFEERNKIIALTAGAIKGDREKVIEAGMDGFLSKPVKQEEIYGVLKKYISGRRILPPVEIELAEEESPCGDLCIFEFCRTFYGVDIKEGLERSLGKESLYLKFLENFSKKIRLVYASLERELRKENYEELKRLSHKVRGISGTLAVKGVYNKIGEFEDLCESTEDKEQLKVLLEKVKVEVDNFEKALDIVRRIFKKQE